MSLQRKQQQHYELQWTVRAFLTVTQRSEDRMRTVSVTWGGETITMNTNLNVLIDIYSQGLFVCLNLFGGLNRAQLIKTNCGLENL